MNSLFPGLTNMADFRPQTTHRILTAPYPRYNSTSIRRIPYDQSTCHWVTLLFLTPLNISSLDKNLSTRALRNLVSRALPRWLGGTLWVHIWERSRWASKSGTHTK